MNRGNLNENEKIFDGIHSNVESLLYSCLSYKNKITIFLSNSIATMNCFYRILEQDVREIKKSRESPTMAFNPLTINIFSLNSHMRKMFINVQNELKYFDSSVVHSLIQLKTMCGKIKKTINHKERMERKLGSLEHELSLYINYKDVNMGSHQRVEKHRQRTINRISKYNARQKTLSKVLEQNLDVFQQMFRDFLDVWFINYYFTTLRIAATLHGFSWNCPELRKIGLSGCTNGVIDQNLSPISKSNIVECFHENQDLVMGEIENLKITDFLNFM
ncbi:hypothetical protein NCAS_0J02070 [Naumovozyma castellii]|uniref:Uncharacterized protein n=1 Tax=Naumovozyma castellii TaxID=27288 RepID=G0VKZ8_NAUCA|nr:hypothetical protein NCAS_0J02070 [Naumovozyma castellii CBS 4309]CCC72186.1 hypothetical protein NCAS_0J02070 [Naumovozyma castellii CBS 4309]